ncbi:uncharacterized protein LOC121990773, partial [Zingiber officinale]|uniref:uncharacterized protein LOC121990773 n=1 Tax=Zingiber officinale TaxID=94328 RepID=UPI001C4CCB77
MERASPPGSPPSSDVNDEEESTDVSTDVDEGDDDELEQFNPPRSFDEGYYRMVNKLNLDEGTAELVWLAQNKPDRSHVNLMDDPVLSVVIDSQKTQMALELIKRLPADKLEAKNCNGDTALHVAATIGDAKVAKALLNKSDDLADIRNSKGETPLHKAALYGQQEVFQL